MDRTRGALSRRGGSDITEYALALALIAAIPARAAAEDGSGQAPVVAGDIVVIGSRIARPEMAGLEPVVAIGSRQVTTSATPISLTRLTSSPDFRGRSLRADRKANSDRA